MRSRGRIVRGLTDASRKLAIRLDKVGLCYTAPHPTLFAFLSHLPRPSLGYQGFFLDCSAHVYTFRL